jgi:squalene-hopene/tetraprenyl-beta-curcumene cyclase
MARSVSFLDKVNAEWGRKQACVTCHTNFQYMIARPLLGPSSEESREVRQLFERQVSHARGSSPIVAVPLVLNDAASGNVLSPISRTALDNLMSAQRPQGGWPGILAYNWPFEDGDYYVNVMAAVAISKSGDEYAKTEKGSQGLAKLQEFLRNAGPQNLHHRALLLWASASTPRLMDEKERAATMNELLALQRPDGGWSLASLGNWRRHDGSANDPSASPSDGYGTGLVTYVLRQTGMSAQSPALSRSVEWLKTHQRSSGRWFTPSLNYDDGINIITNAGTAYALMALRACGVEDDAEQAALIQPQ